MGITIEHPYYKNRTGKFYILPTAKTEVLMRNRGILFKQTDNGCQWLIAGDCSGFLPGDQLECALQVQEAGFMYVTQLEGYQPQSFYRLELSGESRTIDVASALLPAGQPPMGGPCLCHICIGLTPEMPEQAKNGKPLEYRLRFNEACYYWEYLFVRRNADTDEPKILLLEDSRGNILFSLSRKLTSTPYGDTAWQIVSASPVPCRENPDCRLLLSGISTAEFSEALARQPDWQERLAREIKKDPEEIQKKIQAEDFSILPVEIWSGIIADHSLRRRPLSHFLPCPQPGKFRTESQDRIRQVCYI